jgi:hypothetical protein
MRGGRSPLKLGRWGSKGNSESPWRFSLWNFKKPFLFAGKEKWCFESSGNGVLNVSSGSVNHPFLKNRFLCKEVGFCNPKETSGGF